ncbi:Peptidase S8/S53 domain-containing protein [Artemisia annua]|uniref:Peptidase S8/S53 domain-containing protein n=1 Tax=Artemisia annua TaxID=35608 RepID=A0A2U1NQJ7_ARTAN|nr:Peptidase S8/S53 domain-containing protein [Artemisia annua]
MDNPNSAKEEFKCIAVFVQVKEVKRVECGKFKCVKGKKYRVEDLNYPSFAVPLQTASRKRVVKYTRILTNVGTPATYKVSISLKIRGVKITVEPEELTFVKKNEKKTYTVTFTALSKPSGTNRFARLTWSGGKYVVSSPIAFSWE